MIVETQRLITFSLLTIVGLSFSATAAQKGYLLTREQTHNRWNKELAPILEIDPGDTVTFETQEATDGQITPQSKRRVLEGLDSSLIHALTGPVSIRGAEPGDVLEVKIISIETAAWGWSAILPGFGLLNEEFDKPYLKIWRLDRERGVAEFRPGITIPLRPFCGVMGVALPEEGEFRTIPPRRNGGNMDVKHLTAGTTLYLPVFVDGALFSVGDCHAAQGDGEVCGTAIEAPMTITLKFRVLKGRTIEEPQYETDAYYAVTAFDTTLDGAMKKAARFMIDYLVEERGLKREDAYLLSSVAVDFKIAEVVDVPHLLVTAHLPKSIFTGGGTH